MPKQKTPKLCGILSTALVEFTLLLIYSRNSTCYNFHPQSIPCLQTYSLGFFLKQCDLKGCLSIDEQWMRTVCGSKTFNKFQTFERRQHFSSQTASYKILKEISSYSQCSRVSLSEFKFTDYHIALQNLAYLQMQDSLVSNHHIYRPVY